MVADVISWKKSNAMPNNISHNKLTRINEFVFVIYRKREYKTFQSNRAVSSIRDNGQKTYKIEYNFVKARNNDGSNKLNKSTYSTELCDKLLKMYMRDGDIYLDNFSGTGTTLISVMKRNKSYFIGIELSLKQYKYSIERISNEGK